MMSKTFKGANVFMSRNLVPPEIFDTLYDALKHNGAEVFLCCDPSRNGPNDYHVISSNDHEKFDGLQKKGCSLLGPQCVLSCAKERRPLPNQGFTCCLAMDGVKVLASGFEKDEKIEIEKLVTAMGGLLHTKASLDVSFVIVKNVLAGKYKWASNVLKKPIVTLSWLHQCWKEHRVVPQESYRVLPFSGLFISVSRIPGDERKKMEKVVLENGGKYSAEMTRKCTHLVCDAPEGDKYKVATRWGHIHIVTRKWFDQSVARRVCLNEESYYTQGCSASPINGIGTCLSVKYRQNKGVGSLHCDPSLVAGSNSESILCAGIADPDLEATVSQNMSTSYSDAPIFVEEDSGTPAKLPRSDTNSDRCVADDSQTEDNDLYLSECRILFVGFDASDMRKLVNLVRRGGGSRYMSCNEKLTHIVVGTPSENEKKEVRGLAALGVIYVVRTIWLEDCDREKKEVPVRGRHIAHDLLLLKDLCSNKAATTGTTGIIQRKASSVQSIFPEDHIGVATKSGAGISLQKSIELDANWKENSYLKETARPDTRDQFTTVKSKDNNQQKPPLHSCNEVRDIKSSSVFKGRLFQFSSSFPQHRRAEIIQWVKQGGGEVVEDQTEQKVHFTVACHGALPSPSPIDAPRTMHVSSHWIRSCLEDGCLQEVSSHVLYSPLPCRIPLPGFEKLYICVSQYEEKDRLLLRNLCFVLGAKFGEKLTKKVTHLLCKFANGSKYEAACKWGICSVTCEWIYECVKRDEVVASGQFCPKEVTSQDREEGLCTTSQYPTQATKMTWGEDASQLLSQTQATRNINFQAYGSCGSGREDPQISSTCCKRARILKDDSDNNVLTSGLDQSDPVCRITPSKNHITQKTREVSHAVPDVAAAIEDLLEQTSKIHDLKSPGRTDSDKTLFSSDCSTLGQDHVEPQSTFGLSKNWINRADKKEDIGNPSREMNAGNYDGFSETQTDSQVVGYEEDLSGRQMIIDRVRTRNSQDLTPEGTSTFIKYHGRLHRNI